MRGKPFLLVLALAASAIVWLSSCDNRTDRVAHINHMPDSISYNFDIRPILSDKCFICHGPDGNKRQADLRLDIAEEAYRALTENPGKHALVPGDPQSSQVFLRISSEDSTFRMPPVESNLSLAQHEIKLIKKWIEQGAKYEPHWAFVPPVKARTLLSR